MTYGTIFVDLKTKKPVDLLNSRKHIDVTKWLKKHSETELISRDGAKGYAKAVHNASEQILQVADRWHILSQLFEAVKKTIYRVIPSRWSPDNQKIPIEEDRSVFPNHRKTDASRVNNEQKRWNRIKEVQKLHQQKYTVTSIANKLSISRGTVYQDLKIKKKPVHTRRSRFESIRPIIRSLLVDKQTANQIENVCRSNGFDGARSTLNALIAQERQQLNHKGNQEVLSLRQKILKIIWDFKSKDHLNRFEKLHPDLTNTFPYILILDQLVNSFRTLMRKKKADQLSNWMERYRQVEFDHIQSFINGMEQDISAIRLGIKETWSNGVTEGHVNRLKTIKRMMYGRAGFEVLRNRVLYQL
ncbi:transposase [Pseudalkalibacillus hwajinpoensis]|uniref:transposase n=1 Tax=Guptibacillus hwajinpoensis TaxID=208199 RepID=UPI00325AC20E